MRNATFKIALCIVSIALIGLDVWLAQTFLFEAKAPQILKDDLVLATMAQVTIMASAWETVLKR